ncbi:MAG TPA: BTAD domain-containing putative transcriptional regulator [Solirubrobacteraceae bacterium]
MARAHRRDGGGVAARIQLCGALAVELDGQSLTSALPGRQGRLLFAYLVLHRSRAVRRDELEEILEGGQLAPPLSRLRKVLGPERLEGRSSLRLVLPEDAWIDWEVAHDGLERARAAVRAGAWAEAWGPASAARAVAERGLLPGLEAPWIDPLRAELADLRVEALEVLARTGVELGGEELAPAEKAARAAVEAAPFRESAYAVLMDALRARGNIAEALLVFEKLRTLLRDELGTSPGPDLLARHETLLRGEAPSSAEPNASSGTPISARPDARVLRAEPDDRLGGRTVAGPPPPRGRDVDLLERARELASLGGLLDRAFDGEGGVAVVEGAAGVGKTRLLSELRRSAGARGARVLAARAGELERDFAFGVVRQLFEAELADPVRRSVLLDGAAAAAAPVFGGAGEGVDVSFAALHGLYWLAVNLAAEQPTVLAVDDLQWCDPASLRWLVYLAKRLDGIPVLVAATLRSGQAPTDAALVDELLRDPATVAIRPGPLSAPAVANLVADALGEPDPAFADACYAATGGNPLLAGRLLAALRDDGVAPTAANAAAVAEVGARAVSRSVLSRLARLSAGTVEAARAVAILGEGARLPAVAALAELDEWAATDAVGALVRAEILRPEAALGFVHPLVRDAVANELSPIEREARHARAARILAERGAPADEVALHLLVVPPRGDAWAAGVLREAGRSALRRGALDSAFAHLRRALAEPPPAGERADLLLELGQIEREADAPSAAEHLREAYAALDEPRARAAAAESLLWTTCFLGPPTDALPIMHGALAALPDELVEERRGIEALARFTAYWYGVSDHDARLAELREHPPEGEGPGTKMLLAATAWTWAVSDGPVDRCVALAKRAFDGGTLLRHDPALMTSAAAAVLAMADDEDAVAPWDTLRSMAHRVGSAMITVPIVMWRGWALSRRGEMVEAEAGLREALAGQVLWGLGPEVRAYTVGLAAETLLERGDVEGVRRLIEDAVEPPPGSDLRTFLLTGRAQLALAEGDPAAAVAATDELARAASPIENPAWLLWRTARALALHALGRTDEAVALAWEDVGFAKRWGAAGAVGRTLRVLGTVEPEGGVARLTEAVLVLERSPARLELGRALAALGARLLDEGRRADAAPPLQRALSLAETCGATVLTAHAKRLLSEAGGSPAALRSAADALTALERRAASMAADGRDPRAVAQALFLTPRQAEDLLASARRKLEVTSPGELRAALAAGP